MIKKLASLVATLALALALPAAALAAPSPENQHVATNPGGVSLIVTVENDDPAYANLVAEVNNGPDWQGVLGNVAGSFRVNMTDGSDLEAPITLTFNVGAANAGKTAHLYVIHGDDPTVAYETLADTVVSPDGNVSITIDRLSFFAITLEDAAPVKPDQSTDTGSTSPKTGVTPLVANMAAFLVR